MTSFVHHNPIRSLETLQFEEAVKVGERFIGGRGYLPNEQYRQLVKAGRISDEQLDAAIRSVARDEGVEAAGRTVTHFEVLRAHMLAGITPPSAETVAALVERASISNKFLALTQSPAEQPVPAANLHISAAQIRELAKRLDPAVESPPESNKIGTAMTLLSWCDRTLHKQLEWLVNKELIKWCEAFLDEGHAAWPMPYREKGFYEAWKTLAALEWSPCGIADSAKKIRDLPRSPEEAVLAHLDALAIPAELRQDYLSLELASLHGWASFINWRAEQTSHLWQTAYPIDLVQYLAVRLFYERELVDQTCRAELGIEGKFQAIVSQAQAHEARNSGSVDTSRLASAWRLTMLGSALKIPPQALIGAADRLLKWLDDYPECEHGPVWLKAYEAGYQEGLMQKVRESIASLEPNGAGLSRPLAQAMFCIDVRSEPFRRNLEAVGHYETIGFAGFYGIPVRCRALDQFHETDQAPAIVLPKYTVHEIPRKDQTKQLARHNAGVGSIYTIQEMLHDMKHHVLTPYIMVESLGWLFGVQLFGRTLFPSAYRQWLARIKKRIVLPVGTQMTVDKTEESLGLTRQEQCVTIETVLRTMGLTRNFARLVIVCGHCSTSENNPYEAALNCGACGGNSGKPNARLFSAMANKPYVRDHLAKVGISIPADTHFIGAVHNTTTDAIELFDLEDLPDTHRPDLERLEADLKEAAVRTNRERCIRLPGAGSDLSPARAAKEVGRRAGDWSETRPEWGLAGNAAYIIGKRELTRNINLEGRAFLNSYDYRLDSTGDLLEGVMLGPMVVGQWINAEHYFSATDTEIYGSGSKIYHNVVGRIGIMSGPQSDLRTGLAWQSMMNGELPYHEPLRLFVLIEAPRDRIMAIVNRQPILKQLCDNEWIHLMAVDHDSDEIFYRYRPNQGWSAEGMVHGHGTRKKTILIQ
jgi:uncharacterized protein YbcC (UPF0753/DUF2309 family)